MGAHTNQMRNRRVIISLLICCFFGPVITEAQTTSWLTPWEKSTVAIGKIDSIKIKRHNNSPIWKKVFSVVGTGAVFYVKIDSLVIPALITAKHVFHDPTKNWMPTHLQIRYSWFQDKPVDEYFGIQIDLRKNGAPLWFAHSDSLVDLACYPILNITKDIGIEKFPVIPYSDFPDVNDFYPGAEILVMGYPSALGMEFGTRPILRHGVVSWVAPTNPESNKILIDSEIYPGNSGGPVFKIPSSMDKNGNLVIGGRYKFLGIVSQRRFSPNPVIAPGRGEIIIDTKGSKLYSLESMRISYF